MIYHILPVNDLKEHETSSTCHCHPEVRIVDDFIFVVHQSYDRREYVERLLDLTTILPN